MPSELFEFQEQFMTGTFLIEFTQFEKKTGYIRTLFHWEIKLYFLEVYHDFCDLYTFAVR